MVGIEDTESSTNHNRMTSSMIKYLVKHVLSYEFVKQILFFKPIECLIEIRFSKLQLESYIVYTKIMNENIQ